MIKIIWKHCLIETNLTSTQVVQGRKSLYWPTPGKVSIKTRGKRRKKFHSYIDRTGSSLLGEIISVEESFSYFFEPLHSLRSDEQWKNQVAPTTEYIINFLKNLLLCEESEISKFQKDEFILRKSKNIFCSPDSNVLIKAIRLSSHHIAELLSPGEDNLQNLKIIHLLRWTP